MSHNRRITAKELHARSGRSPVALAAMAFIGFGLTTGVLAQNEPAAAPAAQPDPTKPQVKVSEHMTVDLHVKDEELTNVLELLSIQSQKNIVASKSVGGKVSATLYGVTFREALDSILHVNGYGYMERGNFIYVYTLEELVRLKDSLRSRAAKAIKLNYLNAKDAEEFVKPLLSKEGGEIRTSKAAAPFSVPADNPVGGEDYALGATLVVIDYEENIKAIEALLAELDTRPAQVLVEATILQTSLSEQNAFGVDFSIIGDVKFTDFINVGPLGAANSLVRGGNGSGAQGLSPTDNQGTAVTSTPGNTAGPSTFKVGVVAGDLSIFMKMLDEVTDTVIMANPKILSLNRQPSRVLVGRRVGYLSTTSTDTSTTQTVEFLDTGTQLYFRPFVSADGEIRMELKPQVSEAIIREATDATGAAVSIPDEVTQGMTTNVLVRDGQTVVLGGLFRESTQFGRRQVPFLGDIPFIGAAFRGHDDETQRSEIIFLVTPTIVNDSHLDDQADRAVADVDRLRAGARQGLLAWSREKMTSALNVEAERAAREGDYEKATFKISRSLALNPVQPEALRLREKISGERETWPSRSILDDVFNHEAARKANEIQPASPPVKWENPYGSHNIPRTTINSGPQSNAAPSTPTSFTTNTPSPSYNHSFATTPGQPRVQSSEDIADSISRNNPSAANPDWQAPGGLADNGTRVLVNLVRQKIAQFKEANGRFPNLGATNGWAELVNAGYLNFAPVNLYVGGANADTIVVGKKPTTTFTTNYGWVYNPDTGEVWATGFDPSGNALARIQGSSQNAAQATVPTDQGMSPADRD
jgi:type IV pilus assembly protein PilQ